MRKEIGRIIHYYNRIGVAVVEITGAPLRIGDTVHIQGRKTELFQKVKSIQLESSAIVRGEPGMKVGLKVDSRVRIKDRVFLLGENGPVSKDRQDESAGLNTD